MAREWSLIYFLIFSSVYVTLSSAFSTRLVGGSVSTEGRVEVFRNGEWQTVCDNYWSLAEAEVVCRRLGYGYPISATGSAVFGRGTGGQWNVNFDCSGSENDLEDCSTRSVLSTCSHSEDAGVICSPSGTTVQQGSLRLAGSTFTISPATTYLYGGRLEVYVNGRWGTVCDDGWGNNEANVACRQMGFAGASVRSGLYGGSGSSSQTIWLDDVTCTGSETRLIDCSHRGLGVTNCNHVEDINIRCTRLSSNVISTEISVSVSSTSSIVGIIIGSVVGGTFVLICLPIVCVCFVVCCVFCYSKSRSKRHTPVRAHATTGPAATVTVATVDANAQQYPTQPNYPQQQQTGYTAPPDYPQQEGYTSAQTGYQPQPDYPQQTGYPPQTGYPSQTDYPQQTAYQPPPDYPQQTAYQPPPDYSQQTGYPPQPDYPQQTGYPAQTGYPPQPSYPPQ